MASGKGRQGEQGQPWREWGGGTYRTGERGQTAGIVQVESIQSDGQRYDFLKPILKGYQTRRL